MCVDGEYNSCEGEGEREGEREREGGGGGLRCQFMSLYVEREKIFLELVWNATLWIKLEV